MDSEISGQWAIVELMGHKVVSGFIQKSEQLGKPMLRVDVPPTSEYPGFTSGRVRQAAYRNEGGIWSDETPLWLEDVRRLAFSDKPLAKQIESEIKKKNKVA